MFSCDGTDNNEPHGSRVSAFKEDLSVAGGPRPDPSSVRFNGCCPGGPRCVARGWDVCSQMQLPGPLQGMSV